HPAGGIPGRRGEIVRLYRGVLQFRHGFPSPEPERDLPFSDAGRGSREDGNAAKGIQPLWHHGDPHTRRPSFKREDAARPSSRKTETRGRISSRSARGPTGASSRGSIETGAESSKGTRTETRGSRRCGTGGEHRKTGGRASRTRGRAPAKREGSSPSTNEAAPARSAPGADVRCRSGLLHRGHDRQRSGSYGIGVGGIA